MLALPLGAPVARLSGDDGFEVDGNVIRGAAQGTPGPNGTLRTKDSAGTAKLTGTFTRIPFTLTPNYDDNGGTIPDGVFLHSGPPDYRWSSSTLRVLNRSPNPTRGAP